MTMTSKGQGFLGSIGMSTKATAIRLPSSYQHAEAVVLEASRKTTRRFNPSESTT
jgi:hypothetical protein